MAVGDKCNKCGLLTTQAIHFIPCAFAVWSSGTSCSNPLTFIQPIMVTENNWSAGIWCRLGNLILPQRENSCRVRLDTLTIGFSGRKRQTCCVICLLQWPEVLTAQHQTAVCVACHLLPFSRACVFFIVIIRK